MIWLRTGLAFVALLALSAAASAQSPTIDAEAPPASSGLSTTPDGPGSNIVPMPSDDAGATTQAPSPSSPSLDQAPSATPTAAVPTPRPSTPTATPTPSVTPIPDSCLTPSLTLDPPYLRSDGASIWTAHGFKPGTILRLSVLGPTPAGSTSGPVLAVLDSQPVDASCSAGSDEVVTADDLLSGNPNLPSGHYVLEARGIRFTSGQPYAPETPMRLDAPFNFFTVNHP